MLLITSRGNNDLINNCPGGVDCHLIVYRELNMPSCSSIGGIWRLNGTAHGNRNLLTINSGLCCVALKKTQFISFL